MQISKEFLAEAVGLSLLVALLLLGVGWFRRGTGLLHTMEQRQEQRLLQLREDEIMQYDGLCVNGITAISYIKKMISEYGIPAFVKMQEGEFWVNDKKEYTNLRNTESEYYMSGLGDFFCEVVLTANEDVDYIMISEMAKED